MTGRHAPPKTVALVPLARRATGSAGRFACHARAAFRKRVSESGTLPQSQLKGARL